MAIFSMPKIIVVFQPLEPRSFVPEMANHNPWD